MEEIKDKFTLSEITKRYFEEFLKVKIF